MDSDVNNYRSELNRIWAGYAGKSSHSFKKKIAISPSTAAAPIYHHDEISPNQRPAHENSNWPENCPDQTHDNPAIEPSMGFPHSLSDSKHIQDQLRGTKQHSNPVSQSAQAVYAQGQHMSPGYSRTCSQGGHNIVGGHRVAMPALEHSSLSTASNFHMNYNDAFQGFAAGGRQAQVPGSFHSMLPQFPSQQYNPYGMLLPDNRFKNGRRYIRPQEELGELQYPQPPSVFFSGPYMPTQVLSSNPSSTYISLDNSNSNINSTNYSPCLKPSPFFHENRSLTAIQGPKGSPDLYSSVRIWQFDLTTATPTTKSAIVQGLKREISCDGDPYLDHVLWGQIFGGHNNGSSGSGISGNMGERIDSRGEEERRLERGASVLQGVLLALGYYSNGASLVVLLTANGNVAAQIEGGSGEWLRAVERIRYFAVAVAVGDNAAVAASQGGAGFAGSAINLPLPPHLRLIPGETNAKTVAAVREVLSVIHGRMVEFGTVALVH